MTTLSVERAQDVKRARLVEEISDADASHAAKIKRIEAYRDQPEMSDADRLDLQRLQADADMLKSEREVLQRQMTRLDLGSQASATKDLEMKNEELMEWIDFSPDGQGGDPFKPRVDFEMQYDEVDVAQAFAKPDRMVNTPFERPSDGFYSTASATIIRRLERFGGIAPACRRINTPTGNDWKLPNMDSRHVGVGYSETGTAAVTSTASTITNIISKRNGYRSTKFLFPRTADRDAQFNLRLVLEENLARQLGVALAQNLVKGNVADTDVEGIVEGAKVLRTTSGTTANGTSRRIGGNSVAQIYARVSALQLEVNEAYIDGEGGEDGFNPEIPGEVFGMSRATWDAISGIAILSNNSLVSEGRTQLSTAPVRMLKSVPVLLDSQFDNPKGADLTYDANANIMVYGNLRFMLDRRIGLFRLHYDPFGVAGDNNQVSIMMFKDADNRFMGAKDGTKCEAVALLQAAAS